MYLSNWNSRGRRSIFRSPRLAASIEKIKLQRPHAQHRFVRAGQGGRPKVSPPDVNSTIGSRCFEGRSLRREDPRIRSSHLLECARQQRVNVGICRIQNRTVSARVHPSRGYETAQVSHRYRSESPLFHPATSPASECAEQSSDAVEAWLMNSANMLISALPFSKQGQRMPIPSDRVSRGCCYDFSSLCPLSRPRGFSPPTGPWLIVQQVSWPR